MSGPVDFDKLMDMVSRENLEPRGPQERSERYPYTYKGSCKQLAEKFNVERSCCSSCHSDDNLGYSELGELYDDEKGIYYTVCCQMSAKLQSEANINPPFIDE